MIVVELLLGLAQTVLDEKADYPVHGRRDDIRQKRDLAVRDLLRDGEDSVYAREYTRSCCWADNGDGGSSTWNGDQEIELPLMSCIYT